MKIKVIAIFTLFLSQYLGCTNIPESSVKINKTLLAPVQGTATATAVIPLFTYTPTPVGSSFTDTPTPVGSSFTDTPTPVGSSFTDTPTPVGSSFTYTPTPVGSSFTDTPTPVGSSFTYTPTTVGSSFTDTPTPVGLSFTYTPTPVGLFFIPNANVNCRSGPDRIFNIIDIAIKGQSYLINGRNYANDWYYLKFTSNEYCYVLATTGVASGDTSKVRVMLPISTPTFVASSSASCSDFTSESTCNAHSKCKWNFPVTRSGFCDKK